MSNELQPKTEVAEQVLDEKPQFKGYSLNDLKYRRAVVALKKEFARQKIAEDFYTIRNWRPFDTDGSNKKTSKMVGIARKIMGGMNYLDYAMLGFSVFTSARKVMSFFKKKK